MTLQLGHCSLKPRISSSKPLRTFLVDSVINPSKGGDKLERARDLFEQCLEKCPAKFTKNLYLMYSKLEEDFGLSRHAMAVYERAAKAVPKEEKSEIYNIYIKRAAELFGITHTRKIYEKAIEDLQDEHAREICLRYADLETKLGEIDRARAIYSFGSQMCDPRLTAHFWKAWHDFEVKHGNEDTFREMLRIKRSVQAQYNTQVNFMSAQLLAAQSNAELANQNDMNKVEQEAAVISAEPTNTKTPSSTQPTKGVLFVRGETQADNVEEGVQTKNPEEIELAESSDDSDDESSEEDDVTIEQKQVPEKVFGGIKAGIETQE